MKFPKLVIATDGYYTGVLLDGVFIGQGIERLDFSTENKDGEMESTIHIMDLNVKNTRFEKKEKFREFFDGIAEEK